MKQTKKTKPVKAVIHRKKYNPDEKEKARKYYLMGLTLPEISKLLDGCPVRTLEKWQLKDKWTAYTSNENILSAVLRLHEAGKTNIEIGKLLNISRVTVWKYLKQAKELSKS